MRILREKVEGRIFELEELKEPEWNPLVYNESLANSLYLFWPGISTRRKASSEPDPERMKPFPVIVQAKENLQHPPRVYTETAIEQIGGAISLVRHGLAPLLALAPKKKKDVAPVQEETAKALEDYKKWLEKDLLPRSDGDFRLGADKFRKKLHFALASDLPMEELMSRAKAD